jgi:hypothetical protein
MSMAYPAIFTPFNWEDLPSENTPFDKENAQEIEKRLAKFAEEYEIHWRKPVSKIGELGSIYTIKGPNVAIGDVVLVVETRELWIYSKLEEWESLVTITPFWKSPFAKASELPVSGNTIGDVRLVKEIGQLYICIATTGTVGEQWKEFEVAAHHWLAPVAKETNLPTTGNVVGDVRLVEELKEFFICIATSGSIAEQWSSFGHTHIMETPTWVVAEKVSSGIIPGPFRKLATNETQTLVGIEIELGKGKGANEIEYSLERYDAEGTKEWKAIPSLEKLKLKKEEVKAVTVSVALHTKDRLRLNILTISSEPEGLALSAFIEHVAKVS